MKTPSFSSTLLDRIYRSIDEEPDALVEEQGRKCIARSCRFDQDPHVDRILRDCLVREEKNVRYRRDTMSTRAKAIEEDLFSLNSSSSDSSSSGFLSADMESIYGLKQMRTRAVSASRLEKSNRPESILEDRDRTPLSELWRTATTPPPLIDVSLRYRSSTPEPRARVHPDDHSSIGTKSKPRALKIYENLKKVKKPISPGGRLSNFINSLFSAAAGNPKKHKSSLDGFNAERSPATPGWRAAAGSSASSFSSSCLSRNSPLGTGQKLRDGAANRTVRFSPVNVVYQQPPNHSTKAGRSPGRKKAPEEDARALRCNAAETEKQRSAEKVARHFLQDYYPNQKRCRVGSVAYDDDDDVSEDDDASSCSSSDLFELDHLGSAMCNSARYCEELPVYEATRVGRDFTIANGLMMV
ncbi:hypothetical protein SAY86_002942 [Trapa natans]|uniref:Protein BIG GRAIN 1-like B n=1 Tax=Trapa natans TaxID=22666 RepID=A0AAN7LE39_TRANT|nr:hypothetical protein SAY86_002942 [Trapa natans]